MIYAFETYRLDAARQELFADGSAVHIQPQVFDLLLLLVANAHRVVSRDEIIEKVWKGRIVSDDAVSSRIRDIRRVLEDTQRDPGFIRTIRGRGFRFEADVSVRAQASAVADTEASPAPTTAEAEVPERDLRPSIAVLPFQRNGDQEGFVAIEEAIPRELISTLASLRWIKVVSHGSAFQFRGTHIDLTEVSRILNVRYCMTGIVEIQGRNITIDTEISDTRTAEVIWATRKTADVDDIQALRAEIAANIILVAELEIPHHEATRLGFFETENLDAWSALHLGFRHMNRFNRADNAVAEQMLTHAVTLDPTLARGYSGLAFVRFQNAFMRYSSDRQAEADKARHFAEQSVSLQPRDPFGNFMMGRIHWLASDPEGSKHWFRQSIDASPNYTWGYYGSSWANVFTDAFDDALKDADKAIDLSPIDPFRPGMTGNKMWIYIHEGDYPSAVKWAEIAARTPWAHAGMAMFAAASHWLNGNEKAATWWKSEALRRDPKFDTDHLLSLVPANSATFRRMLEDVSHKLNLA